MSRRSTAWRYSSQNSTRLRFSTVSSRSVFGISWVVQPARDSGSSNRSADNRLLIELGADRVIAGCHRLDGSVWESLRGSWGENRGAGTREVTRLPTRTQRTSQAFPENVDRASALGPGVGPGLNPLQAQPRA